jgi:hypothetical protein
MNPALTAAMNFLLGSTKRNQKEQKESKITETKKAEIDKINSMGLFEAINYLKTK